ncbi:MAG: ABC transporter substrate-binding protein [Nitrospirae bacterium]|nr:ABC transporter substrate-binding protein [Nitrospirota bacterium]
MTKAGKIALLAAAILLLLCHTAVSENRKVVVVKSAEIKPFNDVIEGFRRTCDCTVKELSLERHNHNGMAGKILRMNPDAILTIGTDALKHVKEIKDLPIVYTMVPHLPDSISENENLSGVDMNISPTSYINAIISVFPHTKRVGIIYDPRNSGAFVTEALQAAGSIGIDLILKKAAVSSDVFSRIDGMKDKIDVFLMLPNTTVVNSETINHILLFSFQNRIPVFTFSKKYVEMGAVAALGIDAFDLGLQTGEVMRKLLYESDVKPPIRIDARKSTLTINRKIAAKMGIEIRDAVLKKADVID